MKLPLMPASRITSPPDALIVALLAIVMPLAVAPAVKPTPPAKVTLPLAETVSSIAIDSAPVIVTSSALTMPETPATVPIVNGASVTPTIRSPVVFDARVAMTLLAPRVTSPEPETNKSLNSIVLPAP